MSRRGEKTQVSEQPNSVRAEHTTVQHLCSSHLNDSDYATFGMFGSEMVLQRSEQVWQP